MAKAKKKSIITDYLSEVDELFSERNADYGNAFMNHGHIMDAIFPEGVVLETKRDIDRYNMISSIVAKVNRYAQNFTNDDGHPDSLMDAATFCMMLKYMDENQE